MIGSGSQCHVRVHGDPYVSPVHAIVTFLTDDGVLVEDAGSLNGLFVQRDRQPIPLHVTQLARVRGKVLFRPGDTLWLSQQTRIPWDRNRPYSAAGSPTPPAGGEPVVLVFTASWPF